MFTKIEFEAHKETNIVTNEESDEGNHSATSVTTQNVVPTLWPGAYLREKGIVENGTVL